MSSTTPTSAELKSLRAKKVIVPKVWKRPHSTIYGKNVEFGSKLYSDKLGEINGRKFNSELPWQVRNTGSHLSSSSSSSGSQPGYLSSVFRSPESTLLGSVLTFGTPGGSYISDDRDKRDYLLGSSNASIRCPSQLPINSYSDLLDATNPHKYSKRHQQKYLPSKTMQMKPARARIDFYDQYMDSFNRDLHQMSEQSILLHEPLLHRRVFDKYLDFNHEIGIFVPSAAGGTNNTVDSLGSSRSSSSNSSYNLKSIDRRMPHVSARGDDEGRSLIYKRTLDRPHLYPMPQQQPAITQTRATSCSHLADQQDSTIDLDSSHTNSFAPVCTTTQQTSLLPKHHCQIASSPYGQSVDGRKLSLGSINPHSYRPSLPAKTNTVHASDGEEFEFQDRSSPFYTDR